MRPHVVVVCNALEDFTRQRRGINTDSPAASRKIFLLCEALRLAGVRPYVLSLGRGRAGGAAKYFPSAIKRVSGVPVFYAPFFTFPILSELVSLFGPLWFIYRIRKSQPKAAIFYNRMLAYVPVLILTHILGFKNILDLEDGEISSNPNKPLAAYSRWLKSLFDKLCSSGALVACSALSACTEVRRTLCYYGTAVGYACETRWKSKKISVLMGGSLSIETGAGLLIDCIRLMRKVDLPNFKLLRFEVTGGGPCLEDFINLAAESGFPEVVVHGRTTDVQYRDILRRCDVGLALKLNSGPLANTTFPSKVIEFAAVGMLVVTTDISDVRKVIGEGAYYLEQDEPGKLAEILGHVVQQREHAEKCAASSMQNVMRTCAPKSSGQIVAEFIFGSSD
jgi:glycosyltransferase involved in cell wall biosynthesis